MVLHSLNIRPLSLKHTVRQRARSTILSLFPNGAHTKANRQLNSIQQNRHIRTNKSSSSRLSRWLVGWWLPDSLLACLLEKPTLRGEFCLLVFRVLSSTSRCVYDVCISISFIVVAVSINGVYVLFVLRIFHEENISKATKIILNPSDFDYLLTKGNNSAPIDRSSILLRFDPLLGMPVPVSQIQQQPIKPSPQILQQILGNNLAANLSPTLEEDEHSSSASTLLSGNNQSLVVEADNKEKALGLNTTDEEESAKLKQYTAKVSSEKSQVKEQQQTTNFNKHANMSVDVIKDMNIDNDCKKSFENSNSQPDEKQINYKMDELEKKIKNEVLKTEDIEKKLKDAEQREEALIKRITEKDKTITKMTGVIEAYEKAIAELIAGKEELIQSYEKQLAEAKADRDSNYQHLTSLETTFADLHVKYGKSKEMTLQLKSNEEVLVAEKRQILENLRLQEQRYEKMKNHAMQQLEIANKKLESLNKEHSIESTKLKALLKKEEISRASINEQLQQKSRENAELVKICDELINGQGS
ncbi:transforming acidic coiled-coil-containing protein 2 isoform X6 [Anastrepha ludens]|uniref:transforming acidic coiled-coil-containing protein 2 isoform X6 n=1 Tax=Anastrepha ludens TaxID=28586 RepID=UPI0023AF6163|nr:transforming acidic coiled-coil-containing protein 2 isoform X6 [Anastrepha ludens]